MRMIPGLGKAAGLRPSPYNFTAGLTLAGFALLTTALPLSAAPQSYSLYGTPGLLDMPTAESAPDGELSLNTSTFKGQARATLTFQLTPRLSASFRYATINNYRPSGKRTWDRSFDLRYRLLDEGRYRPAVAIGLQDFMGTGLFSSEYIVATKHIGKRLTATAGLGWGRLGSYKGFTNPLGALDKRFETRPGFTGLGGEPNTNRWFRGDAAFFGGIAWAASDRLTLKAEYSSDAYDIETSRGRPGDRFKHRSPLNFGLHYKWRPGVDLTAAYLHGSTVAVGLNFAFNPKKRNFGTGLDTSPLPIKPRLARHIAPKDWGTGWLSNNSYQKQLRNALKESLKVEGMELVALKLSGDTARVQLINNRYEVTAQAIGRSARILSHLMPASVETFRIEPVVDGLVPSTVSLQRRDLEQLENTAGSAEKIYRRAHIAALPRSEKLKPLGDPYPRFNWDIAPYLTTSYFDPDRPVRAEIGAELSSSLQLSPGLSISGLIRQPLAGNLGSNRNSNSVLPHVRTDANHYGKSRSPQLTRLTADYYFSPARNLYGRVSAGYLEKMYGGVSGELLWKPANSRLALGLELNYAKKRDFNQRLGFRDYDIVTGHASAYYKFNNNFHGRIDIGRYLAGDWGATFALDREFENGWQVGAFATFTDVSAKDFGEGSFDKGIRLTIPVAWLMGKPTPRKQTTVIKPLTRDGGARLEVEGRLYDKIRDSQNPRLADSWGRFWK